MIFYMYLINISMFTLAGPDGLDVTAEGLFFCLEGSGAVMFRDWSGRDSVIAVGLNNPEGICVTREGEVLVTEDVPDGRLLLIDEGSISELASGLSCPEGVCEAPDGSIWFTTGGIEAGELLSSLWTIKEQGPEQVFSVLSVFSLSDITISQSGTVYICSEGAGLSGRVSVLRYDPVSSLVEPFVSGVAACEGICLTEGGFPMYLAAEEEGVFTVDENGKVLLLFSELGLTEDIAVYGDSLYATHDGAGVIGRYALHE